MGLRIGWTLLLAAACGKDDTGSTILPPPGETGTPPEDTAAYVPPPPPGPALVVTAAENYTLTQELTIQAELVRSGGDVLLNWGGPSPDMFADMFGQPFTPSMTDELWLMEILYPSSQVADHVEKDDLGFELISTWSLDALGDTSAHTDQLASGSLPFDPVAYFLENDDKTWLAALMAKDADGRLQPRQYLALDPKAGSPTSAQITQSSSSLTWSAKLGGGLVTQAGWPSKDPQDGYYRIDWRGLGNDALGKPYDKQQGDLLFFGKVDGLSAADVATNLLNLKAQASEWYEMDVRGEDDARLDLARSDGGAVFRDFSAGTWVIGVTCEACLAPFPLWLTTIEVQP